MGRKISLFLLFVLPVALLFPQPAYADVAPPDYPPGAAVGTESATNVEMLSEVVTITIEGHNEPVSDFGGLAADHIVAHVDAFFNLTNMGSETESLEVWFPLGVPDGFDEINEVRNFTVTISDKPVTTRREEVPGRWDYLVPRATWNMTFGPSEMAFLRITYDIYPTGYSPYGTFNYILETGAGWADTINSAVVKVRLPYPINRFNLLQNPNTSGSAHPPDYIISNDTLVWDFSDLEPTAADNISLTVLEPDRWIRIANAEANVAANPEWADAHLELAQARVDALSFKYGLNIYGDSSELSELARTDFEQAIALDPQNVATRVEYLDLLNSLWFPDDPAVDWEAIYTNLKVGMSIDPNNEQLLWAWETAVYNLEYALEINPDDALQAMYDDMQSWSNNPPVVDIPAPAIAETATLVSTPQPKPQSKDVPTPVPPSPTPPSTPSVDESGQVCPSAVVVLVLVPVGLVLLRRRE